MPGSIGVDAQKIGNFVDVAHNLNLLPYPFEDNFADEIYLIHVLEHLENPIEKLEEMHRILKPGGLLYLRVPHFSSMGAFTDPTHLRPFGYFSFDCFLKNGKGYDFYTKVKFEIAKREIRYLALYPNSGDYEKYLHKNQCPLILRPAVRLINFLISLSPMFFERVWCFWVGGATEVVFVLKKSENGEK